MEKKYFIIFTMMLASSCTSVKNLEKESTCNVWKDQIIFGPTHVSVGNNKASWSGNCKDLWWNCKNVSATLKKDTGDVFLDVYDDYKINWDTEKPIGKILNNQFTYNEKNPLEKYISYTPIAVNVDAHTVTYRVKIPLMSLNSEVLYHYNKTCTPSEALLGTLAVGVVEGIQNDSAKKR
ncbi:MAG: hypothetical protein ACXVCQ_19285 [Bacteriovorax sp.]